METLTPEYLADYYSTKNHLNQPRMSFVDAVVKACHHWLDSHDESPGHLENFSWLLTCFVFPLLGGNKTNTGRAIELYARWIEAVSKIKIFDWLSDFRLIGMSFAAHQEPTSMSARRLTVLYRRYLRSTPKHLWCEQVFGTLSLMAHQAQGIDKMIQESIRLLDQNIEDLPPIRKIKNTMNHYLEEGK